MAKTSVWRDQTLSPAMISDGVNEFCSALLTGARHPGACKMCKRH
jgi:hypothetical protein